MNSYAVSIVWSKAKRDGTISIENTLNFLNAVSKDEAFGLAYDKLNKEYEDYKLVTKLVIEIKSESNNHEN